LLRLTCSSRSPAPPPPQFSTLSLHDALPISSSNSGFVAIIPIAFAVSIGEPPPTAIKQSTSCSLTKATPSFTFSTVGLGTMPSRSEEHTSELQSRFDLVCRLLLEKKNKHYEQ